MLSIEDIKKLMGLFVTKEELRQAFEEHEILAKEQNNRLMNLVDKVLGEVKTMRQEQIFLSKQHEDHGSIERRLDKIEATPTVAHELRIKRS